MAASSSHAIVEGQPQLFTLVFALAITELPKSVTGSPATTPVTRYGPV
jgi:hypothetical protein